MLVGKHPAAGDTAKSAKGGGTFTGSEALVTFRKGTSAYLLNGTTLTLAPDIRSGTFTAKDTLSGADVSGSFSC